MNPDDNTSNQIDYNEFISKQMDAIDTEEIDSILGSATSSSNIFDSTTTKEILNSLLTGEPLFNSDNLLDNFTALLLSEVKSAAVLACQVILVCIIIGLLTSLTDSFGGKTVSALGTMICAVSITALCMGSFNQSYEGCLSAMSTMTSSMEILLPIMIPLLISMGGISSASILNPVILSAVTGFNFIIKNIVMPLIFVSVVFTLINCITEKDYVNKLAVFLRKMALWITGICITVFTGITAIQGLAAKSADGVLINTARFSIDKLVPIIGGFTADSLEMILKCLGLIKNSVGIAGIIILLSLIIFPIIKMLAIALIYKLSAIVAEPVANKNISSALSEIGSSAITLTVVLAAGAMMFIIFVTVLMCMGGI